MKSILKRLSVNNNNDRFIGGDSIETSDKETSWENDSEDILLDKESIAKAIRHYRKYPWDVFGLKPNWWQKLKWYLTYIVKINKNSHRYW